MLSLLRKVNIQTIARRYFVNGSLLSQRQRPPQFNGREDAHRHHIRTTLYYLTAGGVLVVGLSYAAVPIYRMFCQVNFVPFPPLNLF